MTRHLTWLSLILTAIGIGFRSESLAHPAHAKPVNYPFVVGFERFHSGLDDDDYLAEGGLILLNELNCVACHQPPKSLEARLSGLEGTNLEGVSTRLDPLDLEIMIRNPRFVKKDTVMPSLFAGPDRALEEVEAIKQYLATLTYDLPDYPQGDIDAGRQLYHRIGCVGCHAPELGFRPEGIPENAEIELAGLPSVPMNLADLYEINSLTHFFLHSNEHRPSGRMPDFRLNEEDAANLAAYLKAGPDLVLPSNLTEALTQSDRFESDISLVERGRELFDQKNCTACHTVPGQKGTRTRFRATPLADLAPVSRAACMSERPVSGGVPFYGLDEVQKRAISAALTRLGDQGKPGVAREIDWRMKQLNCYACHERGGVGGVEIAREVYFGFESEAAMKLGRWGHLPPALDQVSAKLTKNWMNRVMFGEHGGGAVRHYMSGRMPVYRKDDVIPLLKNFDGIDSVDRSLNLGIAAHQSGSDLIGANGKNCIQCHRLGAIRGTELPGIDLSLSPERLRFSYFQNILMDPQAMQPGTPMPDQFESGRGDKAEIGVLWRYLESLEKKK